MRQEIFLQHQIVPPIRRFQPQAPVVAAVIILHFLRRHCRKHRERVFPLRLPAPTPAPVQQHAAFRVQPQKVPRREHAPIQETNQRRPAEKQQHHCQTKRRAHPVAGNVRHRIQPDDKRQQYPCADHADFQRQILRCSRIQHHGFAFVLIHHHVSFIFQVASKLPGKLIPPRPAGKTLSRPPTPAAPTCGFAPYPNPPPASR